MWRAEDSSKVELARVVVGLREREFPLADIAEILSRYDDESDLLDYLERQRQFIEERLSHYRRIGATLDTILSQQREARKVMRQSTFQVVEKSLTQQLIAAIRIKGKYCDCGQAFGRIAQQRRSGGASEGEGEDPSAAVGTSLAIGALPRDCARQPWYCGSRTAVFSRRRSRLRLRRGNRSCG